MDVRVWGGMSMIRQGFCELSGLAVVGLLFSAGTAGAQVTPLANVAPSAATAERRTTVTASVTTLYDTNIAQASDIALARRGIEKSDFRVTPAVSADVYRTIGSSFVSFEGMAGYDFNARNSQLNRERIDLTAGAGAQLGFCGAALSASYSRRQSDLGDLNILAPGADNPSRNTETTASVNGTATCGAAVGFRALVIGGYSDARNSAVQRAASNNNAVTYGGGVEYVQPAIGRVRLYGVERRINFFDRDGVTFLGAPEVRSRVGTLSFSRDIGARLSTSIALSYADVRSRGGGGSQSFNGVLWDVAAGLRASSRLRFDLGLSRSVDPSQGFNVDYVEAQNYNLKTTYVVNSRASLVVDAAHRVQNYRYSATAALRQIQDRTSNAVGASLKFAASDRFSFSFDVGYTKVDSDNPLFEYDSLRGGITLSASLR